LNESVPSKRKSCAATPAGASTCLRTTIVPLVGGGVT
jgi:hypothetical protein